MRKVVEQFIIGKKEGVQSIADLKKSLLSGYYSILGLTVCSIYWVLDIFSEVSGTTVVYLACILVLIVSFLLNRNGKRELSNYILLPSINLVVYLFTSSEAAEMGGFIFFPVASIVAFSLFRQQEKEKAIAFSVMSLVLYFAAYFIDFSVLPRRVYTEPLIHFN